MQITLGQGPSSILHQRQDVVVKDVSVCFQQAPHCVVFCALVCHCSVGMLFSANSHVVCMSTCSVLRSVAASFVFSVQPMG